MQMNNSIGANDISKKDNKRNSDGRLINRQSDSIPEAKKPRYDSNLTTPQQPTKVVSLRNIPNDITDLQIVLMALEFGDIINLLYIKAKGQALIEFATINEANSMIQHFRSQLTEQSLLKTIEAAHSSYQQLTIDSNRSTNTYNTIALGKEIKTASVNGGNSCVIKAIITNVVYPVSIDALYQIFSKYGNVLKIILTSNGALIQMKDELQVQQAIHALNGRNMYNIHSVGCNILNLQLSPHKTLDVKYNNSKSWDYTNPLLLMIDAMQLTRTENPLLPVPMHQQMTHMSHTPSTQSLPMLPNSGSFNTMPNNTTSSVTGYTIQSLDSRSCVVQVCNFPEQVIFHLNTYFYFYLF